MRLNIYKPNSKNAGCACGFQVGEDSNLYITAVQQLTWDDSTKKGTFASKIPKKNICTKFNEFEAGTMLYAIQEYTEASFFHSTPENKTQISLKPWVKNQSAIDAAIQSGRQPPAPNKAWGLSFTRNSADKFLLSIEAGEMQVIKRLLELFIQEKLWANGKKKENTDPQ